MSCRVLACVARLDNENHEGTCVFETDNEANPYIDVFPSFLVRKNHIFGCMRRHKDVFCAIQHNCMLCLSPNYWASLVDGEPPSPYFFCEHCIAREKYPDEPEITDGVEWEERNHISRELLRVSLKWEGDEWLRKWNQVKTLESLGFPRPALELIATELQIKDYNL